MKNIRLNPLAGLPKPKSNAPVPAPVVSPPVVAAATPIEPPAAMPVSHKRTTPLPNIPQVRSPSRAAAQHPSLRPFEPQSKSHVVPDHVTRFPVGVPPDPNAPPRVRRAYERIPSAYPPAQPPAGWVPPAQVEAAAVAAMAAPKESFFAEREPPVERPAPVVGAKVRLPFNKPRDPEPDKKPARHKVSKIPMMEEF